MAFLTTAAATIISGLVATGGGLLSKYFTNKDVEAAKAESKSIWDAQQRDKKRLEEEQKRLTDMSIRYKKQQDRLDRKERKEATAYTKRENQFAKQLSLINSNEGLKSNYLSLVMRKAA